MEIEEYAAGLIALNSIFKYYFIVYMLIFSSPYFHPILATGFEVNISIGQMPRCWYLFRIPFALGIISRYALIHLKGEDWFQNKYVPFIS
jgi:ACR3 family arsenite transporter